MWVHTANIIEACIGGTKYPISFEVNMQVSLASIPDKLANVPMINFPKFSISLKVSKILNTISNIHGRKMDSILYPWKQNGKYHLPLYKPRYFIQLSTRFMLQLVQQQQQQQQQQQPNENMTTFHSMWSF